MTTRDARGRFTNADHAAAERVIEAAVRHAVEMIRADQRHGRAVAQVTLYTAGTAADLLLSERAS